MDPQTPIDAPPLATLPYEPSALRPNLLRSAWRAAAIQEAGLVVVVVVLVIILSIYGYADARPGHPNTFLNADNLIDGIATPMSYYAIMAIGATIVIVSGGIDICVGSAMALSGMVTAAALDRFFPASGPLTIIVAAAVIALAVGLLCGLFNGILIAGLRMHPFIVTLGTLSIYRCLATAPFSIKTISSPAPLQTIFQWELFGMRLVPLMIMLLVVIAGGIYLRLMVWGRETYAIGGNEEAARFSGIRVGMTQLRVYAISGLLAGLAGMVSLGRFGTVSSDTGTGYELSVIAAAVVGGASLAGGRGSAIGALLGTLILALIENGINILHLNQEWKYGIIGLAIIIAVALDSVSGRWRNWRLRGKAKHL